MSTLLEIDAVVTLATTADACDRCGTAPDGTPVATADLLVRTPSGPLLVCDDHHTAHRLDFFRQRMWVSRLPDPVPDPMPDIVDL